MGAFAFTRYLGRRAPGRAGGTALRLLLALGLLLLLAASAGPTLSAAPLTLHSASAASGGGYVLTFHPATLEAPPSGYLLLPAAPSADPASGCCCKLCLPQVKK